MKTVSTPIGILIIVAVAVLFLGGAYAYLWYENPKSETLNSKQIQNSSPEANPPSAENTETADWKIYRNGTYGFEVKYPNNFKISSISYKNNIVTFIPDYEQEWVVGVNIPTYVITINKISEPIFGQQLQNFLINHVVFDPSGMHPESFSKFYERKINENTLYFIETGLFEGQLALSYFLASPQGLFSFDLLSNKVDWINPGLNIEEDVGHQYLKQILSTFKFTPK